MSKMDDMQFRQAMGKFATGVTVILTEVEEEVHGMTANAFMSLSLNPKKIVISVGNEANMLEKIKQSGIFTVNVLAEEQQEVSMVFAGQIKEEREVKFEKLDNMPVIPQSLAQVTCRLAGEHLEGDHTLFVGDVTDIELKEGEPLLFYKGKYNKLDPETSVVK
jgi:flavin reductase (DIM6/NTAB) family NADH-FMN oxidoreductase RutF